jgi:CheY-like chemotaxis protein
MHDWQNPATWVILLVDDEIDNLEVVAQSLEFFGATVKSAVNGIAALDILQSFSPTIVVTDLSMPGMDGWQLRARLKTLPAFQNVPILALSAHAMSGDKERALSAGFDAYISKPINVPTLIDDIRAALKDKAPVAPASPPPQAHSILTDRSVIPNAPADGVKVPHPSPQSSEEPLARPLSEPDPNAATPTAPPGIIDAIPPEATATANQPPSPPANGSGDTSRNPDSITVATEERINTSTTPG